MIANGERAGVQFYKFMESGYCKLALRGRPFVIPDAKQNVCKHYEKTGDVIEPADRRRIPSRREITIPSNARSR